MSNEISCNSEQPSFRKPQEIVTQETIFKLKSYGTVKWNDPWLDYESFQLSDNMVPQLEAIFELELEGEFVSETDEALWYVPVHAWRILASKNHTASTPVLINLLRSCDDDNDWIHEDIPRVLTKFGTPSIEAIIKSFTERTIFGSELYSLAGLVEVLTDVVKNHPEQQSSVVDFLAHLLNDFETLPPKLNSYIIIGLVELKAIEHMSLIQRIFARKFYGEDVVDWCWVKEELRDLAELPDQIQFENFKQNDFYYSGDEKFQKLLKTFNSFYNVDDLKLKILGAILAVDMVSPMVVAKRILESHDEEIGNSDFQSEGQAQYFYREFLGLWNQISDCQDKYYPFPYAKKMDSKLSKNSFDFIRLIKLLKNLDAFISGLALGKTTAESFGPYDSGSFISNLENKIQKIGELLDSEDFNINNSNEADDLIQATYNFWEIYYLRFAIDSLEHRKAVMEKMRFMEEHKGVGRNDPCPCGSGKKFKKCCLSMH